MTKRVYRYFIDFKDGQEKWLNGMVANGWRLVRCSQLAYDFESCTPNEYEYVVEFVAHKAYSKSKDYKSFLEDMGYKTFYKNISVGFYLGAAKWRPWGEGAGQIVTSPGGLLKELIIVEKKNDGKPFELHTDLADLITNHSKVRLAYFWTVGGMFSLAVMFLFYAVWMKMIFMLLGAVACIAVGVLILLPALKVSKTIGKLKEEVETSEYDGKSLKKAEYMSIAALIGPALIAIIIFGTMNFSGVTFDSYSARNMVQTSWGNHWNASYGSLSGYKQRRVSLDEGGYTFTFDITTKSGNLSFSITGQDGTEYYRATELSTSAFEVQVDVKEKDKLLLRFDAKEHRGGYKVSWE